MFRKQKSITKTNKMNELEIEYFKEAIVAAKDEFYLDAIRLFEKLVNEFPDSDLADDAFYDLGLCYFQMNQFEKGVESFMVVINEYPDGTISVLNGGNEYGHTAAKAWLGIMNCYVGMNMIDKARDTLTEMRQYEDSSYILTDEGEKISFYENAKIALDKFLNKKYE